jgi:hypothetical protein
VKKIKTFLLFCVLSTTITKAQSITTIAGDSTQGYLGDGGAATAAELYYPWGVTVDKSGNIYIADRSNQRIRKVNTSGNIFTIAGNGTYGYSGDGGPATSAEINSPWEVAVDTIGNIYIADYSNNRIRKVDASGIISTIAGNGAFGYSGDGGPATSAQLANPASIVIDKSGNMYIADLGNYRIREINSAGIISTIAGNGIQSYAGDGGAATAAELYWPNGVTIDTAGNVFIADYGIGRIRKINKSGIISNFAGNGTLGFKGDGGAATSAELAALGSISTDISGEVYIADYGNQRIRKVDLKGVISTIVGTGKMGYSGDGGPATLAELNEPQDVAVDYIGNVYIADYGNGRIRKLILTTGLIEFTSNQETIKLFPNPNNGQFTIQSSVVNGNSVVEVYNMLGEKVYSQLIISNSQLTINLGSQPAGVYLYRVITENGNFVADGKFVIQ